MRQQYIPLILVVADKSSLHLIREPPDAGPALGQHHTVVQKALFPVVSLKDSFSYAVLPFCDIAAARIACGTEAQGRRGDEPSKHYKQLLLLYDYPVNTNHLYNIYAMLDQRRRRWTYFV